MSEKIKLLFIFIIVVIAVVVMYMYQQQKNELPKGNPDEAYRTFVNDLSVAKENVKIEYALVHNDMDSVINKNKSVVIKGKKYYYLTLALQQKLIILMNESIKKIEHFVASEDLEICYDYGVKYKGKIYFNENLRISLDVADQLSKDVAIDVLEYGER